jgi:hypothetical protein
MDLEKPFDNVFRREVFEFDLVIQILYFLDLKKRIEIHKIIERF